MTGAITVEYDISGLVDKTSKMIGALFGNGSTIGECQKALMVETGQLAGRMGDAAGPSTISGGMKAIDKEIKGHLSIIPEINLTDDQQYSSHGDFTWLYASPNALVGINDEDNFTKAGNEESLNVFLSSRKLQPRGNSYVEIGKRGKQRLMRINRVAVKRSQFNYVRKAMSDRVGQLRAAFYRIAKRYVPSKRVPGWVAKKFEAVEANGKSTLNESGLREGVESFIEFAIRSPGVVSNEILSSKFQGAIRGAQESIASKLNKIAKGAKYVFETGQVYFEKD